MQISKISLSGLKKGAMFFVVWLASMAYAGLAFATSEYERNVKFDSIFGLPIPPVLYEGGGYFDAITTQRLTLMMASLFVAAVCRGIWEAVKTKSFLPVCISLSGIPCVLAEIYLDIMGGVVYANDESSIVFTLMGRHMGWFIISCWAGYGGLFGLIAFKFFSRYNLKTKYVWVALAIVCAGQTVLEEWLGSHDGVYYYYGNQPLTPISQLAWWIILPTSGGVCLTAALVYRFRQTFKGWKALFVLLLAPMAFCGFMGFTSLPAWIAVNSNLPWWVNQVLGLITVANGLVGFALTLKLVLQRNPLDPEGIGVEF